MEATTEKEERTVQTSVVRAMRDEDEGSLREWLDTLIGEGAVRVSITRKKPLLGPGGENISGNLETVEERIDEDYIREHWGGGDYHLRIFRPTATGSYAYFRGRSIKIAGPSKMNGVVLMPGNAAPVAAAAEDDGLASQAFQAMQDNVRYERDRAARVERENKANSGFDVAAMQAFNAPILEQLRAAQDMVNALQSRVIDNASKPPPRDEFRDRMMERMLEGESVRLAALRERFDSETRQANENHRDEVKRIHDRHADEIKTQEKRHEREIDMVQRMVDSEGRSKDVAYGARADGLKAEVDRLNRELAEARARIGGLEAIKNQSPTEKAEEIMKLKEAFSAFGGDDKEESVLEKVIGAVGNSEVLVNLVNRYAGPPQEQQPQVQQQMLPPPGVPFQAPDGHFYVRGPDGEVQQIDPNIVRQQRALSAARKRKRAAAAAEGGGVVEEGLGGEQPAADAAPPPRKPDASEVKIAVQFMESAINNGTDPAVFGTTARSLIPGDILAYIRQVGIDEFLNKVAKLENGSPLTTQRGRNFARAVSRFLLDGSTEAVAPTP